MNSRPLTQVSSDARDLTPLTPMDFLHPGVSPSEDPTLLRICPGEPDKLRYTHEKSVHLVRAFWKRWSDEYLCTLRNRNKWQKDGTDPQVGQIIVLVDELKARQQWKLGRIVETIPSESDGRVRTVRIQTDNGRKLLRDVRQIVIIEMPEASK